MRRWAVPWDVVGLAETWLDEESEKGLAVGGFEAVCASRSDKGGGGAQSIRIPKNPEISFCLPTYGFNSASCSERVRDL